MSTILAIDKSQRIVFSFLFRLIVVFYSIFLLIRETQTFDWYINLIVSIVYFTFFILLFGKNNRFLSLLRLFNDFLFIGFILFQISELDLYAYSLVFAPILNCHNHSGEKKSPLLYVFPIVVLAFLSRKFEWIILIPFSVFFIINSFDNLRTKYFRFNEKLNAEIETFFIDESQGNRPYKIYERVIPIFNEPKIFLQRLNKIICVRIEDQKISIVNGSSFVWRFDFEDRNGFISKLNSEKTEKIINNENTIIDGETIENNVIKVCQINSSYYCFVLIFDEVETKLQFIRTIYLNQLISPFFHRLSRIFAGDFQQKKHEIDKLTELEEKITYVSNAVSSMHFIRNKLGPIKNYLGMVKDFNSTTDENKKKRIEPYLFSEREKLGSSMNQILERAEYILTKSNNPFNVSKCELYGLQQLFSDVRRTWSYYFEIENFNIEWNVSPNKIRYDVKYNRVGFELVLANWIANMKRYSVGEAGVVFQENDNEYHIIFFNEIDLKKSDYGKFVEEYSNLDRKEISNRESHGLYEIRDFLNQMALKSTMYIAQDNVYFELALNKHLNNENIDI